MSILQLMGGGEYDAVVGMRNILQTYKPTITLAGWYYFNKNQKVCDIVQPYLNALGYKVMVSKLGRVLAWETTQTKSNKNNEA